jgi:hypothetical protein
VLVLAALFVERLLGQLGDAVLPGPLGQRPNRAVAGDLVVLDPLGVRNERGVDDIGIALAVEDFFAFLDEADGRLAGFPLGRLADGVERLLEAADLGLVSARCFSKPLLSCGLDALACMSDKASAMRCSASYMSFIWLSRSSSRLLNVSLVNRPMLVFL